MKRQKQFATENTEVTEKVAGPLCDLCVLCDLIWGL